jgi:hypothetical protein
MPFKGWRKLEIFLSRRPTHEMCLAKIQMMWLKVIPMYRFSCGQTTSLPYNLEDTVALIYHVLISSYFGFDDQLYKQTIWNI